MDCRLPLFTGIRTVTATTYTELSCLLPAYATQPRCCVLFAELFRHIGSKKNEEKADTRITPWQTY